MRDITLTYLNRRAGRVVPPPEPVDLGRDAEHGGNQRTRFSVSQIDSDGRGVLRECIYLRRNLQPYASVIEDYP